MAGLILSGRGEALALYVFVCKTNKIIKYFTYLVSYPPRPNSQTSHEFALVRMRCLFFDGFLFRHIPAGVMDDHSLFHLLLLFLFFLFHSLGGSSLSAMTLLNTQLSSRLLPPLTS